MFGRSLIGTSVLAATLLMTITGAWAFDETKYPDLKGQWRRGPNANPVAAQGKSVFADQACDACHGDDARGTDSAPSLIGVAGKYPNGQLRSLLKTPNAKMSDGGMQPLDAPDPDLDALVAYLESLK